MLLCAAGSGEVFLNYVAMYVCTVCIPPTSAYPSKNTELNIHSKKEKKRKKGKVGGKGRIWLGKISLKCYITKREEKKTYKHTYIHTYAKNHIKTQRKKRKMAKIQTTP